jgi:hypothetical protein
LTPDFVSAVESSVIIAVESSNVEVSDLTFTVSSRHEEDVKIMYYITLTLVEDETAAGLIAKLKESVSNGNYLDFLKTRSDLAITSVADSVISDLSPTPTPSTAPLPPTESGTAKHLTLRQLYHLPCLRFNKLINELSSFFVVLFRLVFAPNLDFLFFLLRLHISLFHPLSPLPYFLLFQFPFLYLFLSSFLCLSAFNRKLTWNRSIPLILLSNLALSY